MAAGNTNARSSAEGLAAQQQRPSTRFRQQQQDVHARAAAQKENAEQGEGMHWEAGAQQRRCSGGSQGPARGSGASLVPAGGFSLGGAAGAGPSSGGAARNRRASLEPAGSAPLVVVRGRTCTVVDGCLADDPAECITVCVRSFTGLEVGEQGSRRWTRANLGVGGVVDRAAPYTVRHGCLCADS